MRRWPRAVSLSRLRVHVFGVCHIRSCFTVASPEQRQMFTRIEVVLSRLQSFATTLGQDVSLLKKTEEQLKEPFMVVIVGEFNSGKSQLINALLGSDQCRVGVLPTTDFVNVLKYAPKVDGQPSQPIKVDGNVHTIFADIPWLKETSIVDTPGTNAILTKHQEITEHFIPRSDLILFVTSADRPFSESERLFLERISSWHKKVILILNKKDLLAAPDLTQVMDFLVSNLKKALQETRPTIFAVSARAALSAKLALRSPPPLGELQQAELNEQLEKSGFKALETYMKQTLGSVERTRLKLQNPLGVCERLLTNYKEGILAREAILKDDEQALNSVKSDLQQFKSDMLSDFEHQIAKLENIFLRMLDNSEKFLNTKLRVSNFSELLRKDAVKQAFDTDVNANVADELQSCVSSIMEWLSIRTAREAQLVAEFLGSRTKASSRGLSGGDLLNFSQRDGLIQELQQHARNVMSPAERSKEANRMTTEMRNALITTVAFEAGALGFASICLWDLTYHLDSVGAAYSAALFDVTGLLGASLVAVGGLSVLPYKRSQIRGNLRTSIMSMKDRMVAATRKQFESELERALSRIELNVDPYSRFVRAERAKLDTLIKELDALLAEVNTIRVQIAEPEKTS